MAIAPDGTTTADTLVPSADDNTHYIEQSHASGAGQHVASFWVKREGFDWCRVTSPSTANASSYFDLRNGVVGTVGAGCTSTGIQAWGNGWYRCWIEYTGGADAHYHRLYISQADGDDTFAGDGAAVGLYVWGYQHEDDGTVIPSSYVKTTTAAVTRAKDSLTRTIPAVATGKIAVQCTALLGPSHNSTHTKTIVAVDDLG